MLKTTLSFASFLVLLSSVLNATQASPKNGRELCIGAKATQRIGYCRYEFEAYLTNGSCAARGGGWIEGAQIRMNISSPSEFNSARSGIQIIQFTKDLAGGCKNACASGSASYNGGYWSEGGRCNKRSYDP